jgi:hypothetical protein
MNFDCHYFFEEVGLVVFVAVEKVSVAYLESDIAGREDRGSYVGVVMVVDEVAIAFELD